jgi:acyl-CoA synthetase (NDP forming)
MTDAIPPAAVRALLRPQSVAIIGATPGDGRGGWIQQQLVRYGYDGAIYPVNPRYTSIRGVPAYASLADINAPVEFVAVALGAHHAVPVMHECVAAGVRAVLFVASGFAEVGAAGAAIQAEVRRIALAHGIAVCGPNCYGIANIHGRFAAYGGALSDGLRPGPIALLFQSGALTHAAMDPVIERGHGYGYVITTGNEAVLSLADYLEALADDDSTQVIACFVEGLAEPARFLAAARRVGAAGKRLIVLKTGRSALAQHAALAHTGALTGPDAVYDALFRQAGIVRVDDIDELIETAELLCVAPRPRPVAAALVTISGGTCGLAADLAHTAGLELATLADATIAQLRAFLPAFATPNNPLDLTGAIGGEPTLLPRALATLCADPAVGMVALALNTPIGGDAASRGLYQQMCDDVLASRANHPQPHVVFSVSSGAWDPAIVAALRDTDVALLQGIREAVCAMAHWQHHRLPAAAPDVPAGLPELPGDAPAVLGERAALALLARAGMPVVRAIAAADAAAAVAAAEQLGYPVALKLDAAELAHKTEIGGVILDLADAAAVAGAHATLRQRARRALLGDAGVLVQPMIRGAEMLLGVTNHPGLGPVVAFGLGGVLVELLDDIAMRAAPFDAATARAMIDETRAARMLAGYRGTAPGDIDALAQVIARLSALAWHWRDHVAAIDLNPVMVLPAGQGVVLVDALIVRR